MNLLLIIKDAIKHPRSKNEIKKTFMEAGIIDGNGDLKYPYKNIKISKRKGYLTKTISK